MRKLSVFLLFAVLLTLVLAIPAPAADLQAGWYARMYGIHVIQYDAYGQPYIRATGWFVTPPGTYGPFALTDEPFHSRDSREVTVPADVSGVGPSANLDLPIGTGMTIGDPIAWVEFFWETDYDASQMRLELWRGRYGGSTERVWSQQQSDHRYWSESLLHNTELEGELFFRIAVVPEPSSLAMFLAGVGTAAALMRKRRSRP
jgi:hypothetical protein